MSSISQIPVSTTLVVLDIDNVLWDPKDKKKVTDQQLQLKKNQLFPNSEIYQLDYHFAIATTYFFSTMAQVYLENIIKEAEKLGDVKILLSSSWRHLGSVEELKNTVFKVNNFSKYLIDKTYYPTPKESRQNENSLQKYKFELDTRGKQIDYWLRENHKKYCISRLVILDDLDDKISIHFPKFFVHIKNVLNETEAEKAIDIIKNNVFKEQEFLPLESIEKKISILDLLRSQVKDKE